MGKGCGEAQGLQERGWREIQDPTGHPRAFPEYDKGLDGEQITSSCIRDAAKCSTSRSCLVGVNCFMELRMKKPMCLSQELVNNLGGCSVGSPRTTLRYPNCYYSERSGARELSTSERDSYLGSFMVSVAVPNFRCDTLGRLATCETACCSCVPTYLSKVRGDGR